MFLLAGFSEVRARILSVLNTFVIHQGGARNVRHLV